VPRLFSQADSVLRRFRHAENEIKQLQQTTFYSKNESERFESNKQFIAAWDRIMYDPRILKFNFDSLRDVSVLYPPGKKFMLVTWNIPRNDGTHVYFGYLAVNSTKRIKKGFLRRESIQEFECFKLLDRSALVKSPETFVGTPDKWFGMLYTQIVACGENYTLLGWDGNDKLTQRKFVDVLYFKTDGTPVFGKDIFPVPKRSPKRIMFEYSSEVTMSLRYQPAEDMIIYSHLSPSKDDNTLEGQYQFYGPDMRFDALVCKGGKWVVQENIEARNEKSKNDNRPKPDPHKQTPVYKPR
jgi:hypothetical protein